MNHSQVKEIVEKAIHDSSNYNFLVSYADGSKEKKRLFISRDGFVCEFKKRSRTRGRCISCEELWRAVEPIKADTDKVTICKRNMKSIIKYLSDSGLWPDILADMKKLQQLKDEDLDYLCKCEYDEHNTFMQEHGINHISPDMYYSLISKRGIITINWGGATNEWIRRGWLEALNEKRKYSMRWTVSYDNSVEYNPEGERAWYSKSIGAVVTVTTTCFWTRNMQPSERTINKQQNNYGNKHQSNHFYQNTAEEETGDYQFSFGS